ncbi:MAG: hypothetical protein Kow00124_29960 [Anaerolineae bacterium]
MAKQSKRKPTALDWLLFVLVALLLLLIYFEVLPPELLCTGFWGLIAFIVIRELVLWNKGRRARKDAERLRGAPGGLGQPGGPGQPSAGLGEGWRKPGAPTSKTPAPTSPPPTPARIGRGIFISYRRSDSADATGRLYDRLVAHYGRERIFKDVDSIPLGADFRQVIDGAVGGCAVVLAIIGRGWLSARDEGGRRLDDPADFVRLEIESALRRGIPVIPVLVSGAVMPRETELPQALRELTYRNGTPVRPDPDFHADVDRLIRALDNLLRLG